MSPIADESFLRADSTSNHNDRQAAREDEALLGNRKSYSVGTSRTRTGFWRDVGLFVWAVIATAAVIVLGVLYQHQVTKEHGIKKHTGKRNLIFMVSDGMGPASLSMTRSFRQFQQGRFDHTCPHIDHFLPLSKLYFTLSTLEAGI